MRVEIAESAEFDLESIADYIARDNPRRALSFAKELRQRCFGLASFPRRFPQHSGHEEAGIYKAVHAGYLIFFKLDDQVLSVIRIIHGAVDYAHLLDDY
jgi:plasmid stabilization system protein ParE